MRDPAAARFVEGLDLRSRKVSKEFERRGRAWEGVDAAACSRCMVDRYAISPAIWRTAWRAKVSVRPHALPTMYSG